MLRDEGVGFGPQRGGQHPPRPVTGDLGQRIIHRFRLTQGDDVGIVLHGVSFLLEVLAGFDIPPFQISVTHFPAQLTLPTHGAPRAARPQRRVTLVSNPLSLRGPSVRQ